MNKYQLNFEYIEFGWDLFFFDILSIIPITNHLIMNYGIGNFVRSSLDRYFFGAANFLF